MDRGATIQALQQSAKRQAAEEKRSKAKLARVQQKEQRAYHATAQWLRMVWLLGTGDVHLMKSAWMVHQERLDKIWDPVEIASERIWNCVARDFEDERLSDDDAWSLFEPTSTKDIDLWCQAWEFYVEWQLARAVVQVNLMKKTVASSDYIQVEYRKRLEVWDPCLPDAVKPRVQASLEKRRTPEAWRQWLCRWRCRWCFKWRSLPSRSLIPDAQFFEKVTSSAMT